MFRRVDTMLRRYLDRKVCHTGVYPTQHRLLMELYRNPNCSQVGLAEKFDVSAAAIAVSLKKLEKGERIHPIDVAVNALFFGGVIYAATYIFIMDKQLVFFQGAPNKEIILANKKYRDFKVSRLPLVANLPTWAMNKSWGDGGLYATFNFVKFYEKKDGTKADWSDDGGDNLMDIYKDLDPRFAQTIAYHGSKWSDEVGVINFLPNGAQSSATDKTRHLLHKWVPRTLKVTPPLNSANVDWIVFRVAELYLNYAEALNEYNDAPSTEAFNAVAKVRARSGMPAFPASLTKDEFREKLRNERGVELAFEDHRFWDIRRWMIAEKEGVMQGKMYGLKIKSLDGSTTKVHYDPYVFEQRSWSRRSYLHPIFQAEVNKGYLVQNPGW